MEGESAEGRKMSEDKKMTEGKGRRNQAGTGWGGGERRGDVHEGKRGKWEGKGREGRNIM